jgi:vancomycin resistance protein YoaR
MPIAVRHKLSTQFIANRIVDATVHKTSEKPTSSSKVESQPGLSSSPTASSSSLEERYVAKEEKIYCHMSGEADKGARLEEKINTEAFTETYMDIVNNKKWRSENQEKATNILRDGLQRQVTTRLVIVFVLVQIAVLRINTTMRRSSSSLPRDTAQHEASHRLQ